MWSVCVDLLLVSIQVFFVGHPDLTPSFSTLCIIAIIILESHNVWVCVLLPFRPASRRFRLFTASSGSCLVGHCVSLHEGPFSVNSSVNIEIRTTVPGNFEPVSPAMPQGFPAMRKAITIFLWSDSSFVVTCTPCLSGRVQTLVELGVYLVWEHSGVCSFGVSICGLKVTRLYFLHFILYFHSDVAFFFCTCYATSYSTGILNFYFKGRIYHNGCKGCTALEILWFTFENVI